LCCQSREIVGPWMPVRGVGRFTPSSKPSHLGRLAGFSVRDSPTCVPDEVANSPVAPTGETIRVCGSDHPRIRKSRGFGRCLFAPESVSTTVNASQQHERPSRSQRSVQAIRSIHAWPCQHRWAHNPEIVGSRAHSRKPGPVNPIPLLGTMPRIRGILFMRLPMMMG
jgi:hypothetical protein